MRPSSSHVKGLERSGDSQRSSVSVRRAGPAERWSPDVGSSAERLGLLLLPDLVEEGEGRAAPLRNLEAGELLVPHVHAGQHVQGNERDVARQDVLVLVEELDALVAIQRAVRLVDDRVDARVAIEEVVEAARPDLLRVI